MKTPNTWLKSLSGPRSARSAPLADLHTQAPPEDEVSRLRERLAIYEVGWPPGHFYSPVPSLAEVSAREDRIFVQPPAELPGIDLNVAGQLAMLREFGRFAADMPFKPEKQPGQRFYFENENFRYGEAIALYAMIRHLRPRRIVEVGSGYSSCAMLDTNEQFFANSIQCTFIEPFADLLRSLLLTSDLDRVQILECIVQDVDMSVFTQLESGDILFIDSSHVTKTGNDVNHLYFEVLPRLASGVSVHIHDIGYPFEYPKSWVYQGRGWNEAYLLRAFLLHNSAFEIEFFNAYLAQFHLDSLRQHLPQAAANPGSSIWLTRR